jgi:hypothetical protein
MLTHDDVDLYTPYNLHLRDTRDYVNQSGLSRTAIFNQVEASLARLDTPYIDVLQIHRSDLDNTSAEVSPADKQSLDNLLLILQFVGDDESTSRFSSEWQGSLPWCFFDVDMAVCTLQSRCRKGGLLRSKSNIGRAAHYCE